MESSEDQPFRLVVSNALGAGGVAARRPPSTYVHAFGVKSAGASRTACSFATACGGHWSALAVAGDEEGVEEGPEVEGGEHDEGGEELLEGDASGGQAREHHRDDAAEHGELDAAGDEAAGGEVVDAEPAEEEGEGDVFELGAGGGGVAAADVDGAAFGAAGAFFEAGDFVLAAAAEDAFAPCGWRRCGWCWRAVRRDRVELVLVGVHGACVPGGMSSMLWKTGFEAAWKVATSLSAPAEGPPMRSTASQRSASARERGIMISSKDSGPAASIIGRAMLTPMMGVWPRRRTSRAAWFMWRRLAARAAASAFPAVYGPEIMIHMRDGRRACLGGTALRAVMGKIDVF